MNAKIKRTSPNLAVFALGPHRSRMTIVELSLASDVGNLALASKGVYVLMVSSLPSFDVSGVANERLYNACRRIVAYNGLFWLGTPLFMVTFDFCPPYSLTGAPAAVGFKIMTLLPSPGTCQQTAWSRFPRRAWLEDYRTCEPCVGARVTDTRPARHRFCAAAGSA